MCCSWTLASGSAVHPRAQHYSSWSQHRQLEASSPTYSPSVRPYMQDHWCRARYETGLMAWQHATGCTQQLCLWVSTLHEVTSSEICSALQAWALMSLLCLLEHCVCCNSTGCCSSGTALQPVMMKPVHSAASPPNMFFRSPGTACNVSVWDLAGHPCCQEQLLSCCTCTS